MGLQPLSSQDVFARLVHPPIRVHTAARQRTQKFRMMVFHFCRAHELLLEERIQHGFVVLVDLACLQESFHARIPFRNECLEISLVQTKQFFFSEA